MTAKPCDPLADSHGFDRTASHSLGEYVCTCGGDGTIPALPKTPPHKDANDPAYAEKVRAITNMSLLTDRDRRAKRNTEIVAMLSDGHTLRQVSEKYGITRQRAHQIYKRETSRIGVKTAPIDENNQEEN